MGVGRDMTWARYTTDQGAFRAVRIDKALLDAGAVLGFAAYNRADPFLPAKYMRYALALDPATGQRRKVHIGSTAGTLWTGAVNSIALKNVGAEDPVTYAVTVTRGEKIPRAADVANI